MILILNKYIFKIKTDYTIMKNYNNYFGYLIQSSLFFVFSLVLIFSFSVMVSCQDKNQTENTKSSSQSTAVNVCELISQTNVEQTFTVSVENVKNTVQNSAANGQSFASQCTYYVKSSSYKTIAIMVSYSAKETSPKTFDELVAKNTPDMGNVNEEQKKILDEIKNSFQTGTKINSTDEIGVWYNWAETPSLIIYFREHYQLIINLIGFEYNNENMEACKKIADQLVTTF